MKINKTMNEEKYIVNRCECKIVKGLKVKGR